MTWIIDRVDSNKNLVVRFNVDNKVQILAGKVTVSGEVQTKQLNDYETAYIKGLKLEGLVPDDYPEDGTGDQIIGGN